MPANSTARGIGLGHRPELAADLIAGPSVVDFVEVVAEACIANPVARREAHACKALWPVILHGVKLSLGSADGIDDAHAQQRLGRLARELDAPLVSEHASFTRGGGREIGHLTRLPYTRAAIGVLARNVARARRFLPDVPLLLENVAATIECPDDLPGHPCRPDPCAGVRAGARGDRRVRCRADPARARRRVRSVRRAARRARASAGAHCRCASTEPCADAERPSTAS